MDLVPGLYSLTHPGDGAVSTVVIHAIGDSVGLWLVDMTTTTLDGDKYVFGILYHEEMGVVNKFNFENDTTITYSTDNYISFTPDGINFRVSYKKEEQFNVSLATVRATRISSEDLVAYVDNQVVISNNSSDGVFSNISRFYYITPNNRLHEYHGSKIVNSLGAGILYADSVQQYAVFSQSEYFDNVISQSLTTPPTPSGPLPSVSCANTQHVVHTHYVTDISCAAHLWTH